VNVFSQGWEEAVHRREDRLMSYAVGVLVVLVLALIGFTVAYVLSAG
jgi:hypothetical protein